MPLDDEDGWLDELERRNDHRDQVLGSARPVVTERTQLGGALLDPSREATNSAPPGMAGHAA